MLIAQVTDLHIGPDKISELNDARLEAVVAQVNAAGPDVVLATGDLTEGGDAASYERVKALLKPLKAPVLPAVGNHDRRAGFASVFDATFINDDFVQYAIETGPLRLVVLDTLQEGRHGGAFCDQRADWLRSCLDERPEAPTLIALHHPPVRTGIAWMDANVDGPWTTRLAAVLQDSPQVVGLICGHTHRPISASFAGRPLIVAPSCAPSVVLDLAQEQERPADPHLPRIIEEDPGFALHQWTGDGLLTHFGQAGQHRIIASFDVTTRKMVAV